MEVRECQGDEREGPRGRGRHGRRFSGEITKEDWKTVTASGKKRRGNRHCPAIKIAFEGG